MREQDVKVAGGNGSLNVKPAKAVSERRKQRESQAAATHRSNDLRDEFALSDDEAEKDKRDSSSQQN